MGFSHSYLYHHYNNEMKKRGLSTKMKLIEVIREVSNDMKEQGYNVNQNMTKAFLQALENTVDKAIKAEDSVSVIGVKFATKEQKGKEGIIALGSRAGETYKTNDKIVPVAKYTPSKKAELSREK